MAKEKPRAVLYIGQDGRNQDRINTALSPYTGRGDPGLMIERSPKKAWPRAEGQRLDLIVSQLVFFNDGYEGPADYQRVVEELVRLKEITREAHHSYLPLALLTTVRKEQLEEYQANFDLIIHPQAMMNGMGGIGELKRELGALLEEPTKYQGNPRTIYRNNKVFREGREELKRIKTEDQLQQQRESWLKRMH